jgi:hypothetical protein
MKKSIQCPLFSKRIEEDPGNMKRRLSTVFLGIGLVVAVLAGARQAQAVLGESVDSITTDQKTLSLARVATTVVHTDYTVHEIRSDANTIREYVASSGLVFAIAWDGRIHPDLTPLLGSYTGEYQDALRQTPRQPGRRQLQVKTDRVVVEKWGHMRKLQGRAYAPALIPPGVSIDEIN